VRNEFCTVSKEFDTRTYNWAWLVKKKKNEKEVETTARHTLISHSLTVNKEVRSKRMSGCLRSAA